MKLRSWSPTRLFDYEACPASANYKHNLRTCPLCFRGKVVGGYETEAQCDTCKGKPVPGPALVRGSRIGLSLERYVKGEEGLLDPEVRNPLVKAIAAKLRAAFAKGKVAVELLYTFDSAWGFLPGDGYKSAMWFNGKLDVLHKETKKVWQVLDWKTGGIDKRTGKIRASEKYDTQLELYNIAVLTAHPEVQKAEASLVFTDATGNPVIARPELDLTRKQLPAAQTKYSLRVKGMMNDEIYAPKPSRDACQWCPYKKALGGPCPF